jgi:hypothetical protein
MTASTDSSNRPPQDQLSGRVAQDRSRKTKAEQKVAQSSQRAGKLVGRLNFFYQNISFGKLVGLFQ